MAAEPVVLDSGAVQAFGANLSILFSGFEISLQGAGDSLSAIRTAAYQAQVDGVGDGTWLRFDQHLRGAVHKDANARVVLFFDLGGTVRMREYAYGTRVNTSFTRTAASRARWRRGQRYHAVVTVLVQRRTPDAVALVSHRQLRRHRRALHAAAPAAVSGRWSPP